MPATITATEAKNRFGEVIRRVYKNGETLIVERGGLPVVVIMPIQEYQATREEYFVRFSRQLGQAAERQGLTEEQLLQELEEDKQSVYQETYGAET
ncbi:TPA: type II toxin-antitoxin system Phd/YefM family antitoxin [Candidatus Bipolaricaulota bacterium]|nr:type II toxin-antitoxin system Phd/YefM family antitoxin [Candidatus Bipolaricaulota bacterium]